MAEEKELRKMNRTELIEIIYALKKEEEEVNQKLEEAEQQLQNRTIQIAKAGSIAEAAMELNHVFASAQKAADEYLNSVRAANEEAEQYAKRIRKEAEEEALAIRAKTEEETELLRKQTEIAVHAEMEKMKMTCSAASQVSIFFSFSLPFSLLVKFKNSTKKAVTQGFLLIFVKKNPVYRSFLFIFST